ncbi:Tumor necrosis factor receptor superfamily member 27 [Mizuhopecten yessoensis]|uniref:Tumor necrosis factor receptor superfamily member 27 n=1 Tax=Mizuhopecten yessoensis TaxID=6573 RepID=A0A210Q2Y5_MIZYE|nr:Tumor necrosis factor receptor superfamily member 27 [Mizuhopecten yessoensis]
MDKTPISREHKVSFCKQNYTNDYCHRCPVGSVQSKAVDSATVNHLTEILKCVSTDQEPSCPPETVLVLSERKRPTCECDTARGYAGDNFLICISCPECPPGTELKKDGQCSHCPPGTFKTSQGFGPCRRLTNCGGENRETLLQGNTTADAVCGNFLTTATTESASSVPDMSTRESQPILAALSSDGLEGFSLTGDENNPIYSSHEMEMHDIYNNQQRLMLVTMAIQVIFFIAILVIITVGVLKIRKMSRDLPTRRGKDVGKDEECLLVASPSDNDTETARIKSAYALDKYESEQEFVSLYQPVTMETLYPDINSRPCTPTAPRPSILDFRNNC